MNGGIQALDVAYQKLFAPSGLDEATVGRAMGELGGGSDLADLYFETTATRRLRMEDGKVNSGSFSVTQGVGVRASSMGRVAFAHSADLRPDAVMEVARAVRTMQRHGNGERLLQGIALPSSGQNHMLYPATAVLAGEDMVEWTRLLSTVDAMARDADPRVVRVDASLRGHDSTILIADIDRGLMADIRPGIHLTLTVVAEKGERRAQGSAGLGGRHGLAELDMAKVAAAVTRAVRVATTNLDARPAPAGTMPVVLAPGYPGVLFHEAVGHGLEGDFHRKKMSVFADRMGQRVAAPGVTVIDDGGIPGRLGSLGIDDEGTPPDRTVLIEDGILTGLMQDRLNAALMNAKSTGNGRRQSYAHLPLPRMTNTFLAAGDCAPADILASVKSGLFAVEFGGGQVDTVSGRFNFSTTEAWLIENGKLTEPVDGATLIGVGHEALRGISMIGNDLELDSGQAVCGKQGQQVDVSVGQPTIRIDGMMVGGSAA